MPEQPLRPPSPAAPAPLANLHAVAQLLREAKRLGPEEQRILAEVIDELARTLESPQGSSPELMRLADSTTHLLQAMHQRHDTGLLTAAQRRVEDALGAAETRAPFLVGLVRRLIEALAATGI
jgi:hypothetical protein